MSKKDYFKKAKEFLYPPLFPREPNQVHLNIELYAEILELQDRIKKLEEQNDT